jgi:hypothetical protein
MGSIGWGIRSALLLMACLSVRADAPAANSGGDTEWHTVLRTKKADVGKLGGSLSKVFTVRTAQWRLLVSTDKGDAKTGSSFEVLVWVEEADASGHKSFRQMNSVSCKGVGGDSKELTLDNGFGPDGKPRKIKVILHGKNFGAEWAIQDQSTDSPPEKKQKEKKK